jgi:hypothetical protein
MYVGNAIMKTIKQSKNGKSKPLALSQLIKQALIKIPEKNNVNASPVKVRRIFVTKSCHRWRKTTVFGAPLKE